MQDHKFHCFTLIKQYINNLKNYRLEEHYLILEFLSRINCLSYLVIK